MTFPTPDTVHEWDDASLFAETGFQAANRQLHHGFDSLNEVEQILCCLFLFDNDVNNGGLGMWLDGTCPRVLEATVPALEKIGATQMASFVRGILSELGDLRQFTTMDEWQVYFERPGERER